MRAVVDALRRVVRDLRRGARDAERSAGISGAQLFVLQALDGAPTSSLRELAQRTLTDQSSVSVVVRRLTDAGLVARRRSALDARAFELRLTAAGRRLLARAPEPTQRRLVGALRRMPAADLVRLTRGLSALTRHMGIEATVPGLFFEDERRRARS